jgi:hypothetical protein
LIKKNSSKKKLFVLCIIVLITLFISTYHNIENNKRKDITYSAQQYLTTGMFNKYKLYNVDFYHLLFSDTKEAILEVQGMEYKVPHKTAKYKLFMNKNSSGIWSVNKLVPISNMDSLNENETN